MEKAAAVMEKKTRMGKPICKNRQVEEDAIPLFLRIKRDIVSMAALNSFCNPV